MQTIHDPAKVAKAVLALIIKSNAEPGKVLSALETLLKKEQSAKRRGISRRFKEKATTDMVWREFILKIWPRRWSRGSANHSKFEAWKAWALLTDEERAACREAIEQGRTRLGKVSAEEYHPMLSTWIRRFGWEDGELQQATPAADQEGKNQIKERWERAEAAVQKAQPRDLEELDTPINLCKASYPIQ